MVGFLDDADRVVVPFQKGGDCCSEKLKAAHAFHLHTIDGRGPRSLPISLEDDHQLYSFGNVQFQVVVVI